MKSLGNRESSIAIEPSSLAVNITEASAELHPIFFKAALWWVDV
jgi:hypothetical protein